MTDQGADAIGRDVKLTSSQLWVRHRGAWRPVEPQRLSLSMRHPTLVEVMGLDDFDAADSGLTVREISRRVGAMRIDREVWDYIWKSPQSLRGDHVAVSFELGEVVWEAWPTHPSELVYPFRWFSAVRLAEAAYLVARWKYFPDQFDLSLKGVPMDPEELARRMGLPLERADE